MQQATIQQPQIFQTSNQNLDAKVFNQNEKPKDVRKSNILAAKGKKHTSY